MKAKNWFWGKPKIWGLNSAITGKKQNLEERVRQMEITLDTFTEFHYQFLEHHIKCKICSRWLPRPLNKEGYHVLTDTYGFVCDDCLKRLPEDNQHIKGEE